MNSAKTRLPPQSYKPRLSGREEGSTVDGGRVLASRLPMSPLLQSDGSPLDHQPKAADASLQLMGLAAPQPAVRQPIGSPTSSQQSLLTTQQPTPAMTTQPPVPPPQAPAATPPPTNGPMPQMFAIRNPNDNSLTFFQHIPQTGSISQVTGPLPGVTRTNVHEYAPVSVPVPSSDSDTESDGSEVTAAKPSPARRVIRRKKTSSRKASAAARRKLVHDSVMESASEAPSDRESLIAAKVARRLRSSGIGVSVAKDFKPQSSKSMTRHRVSEAGRTIEDNTSQVTSDTQSTVSVQPVRRKSFGNGRSSASKSSGSNTVSSSATVGIQTAIEQPKQHVQIEREVAAAVGSAPPGKKMPQKAESSASTLQMFEAEVKTLEAKQEKVMLCCR